MIYRLILVVLGIAITIVYFLSPSAKNFPQPESAKIMFFHVPEAMLCSLFFLWSAIQAIRFLRTGNREFDFRSLAAIEVGTLMVFLATVTGMIFATVQWGAPWHWDPRQTSILIQLLIYLAYFALRSAFSDSNRAAYASSAYAVFAFLTVPFLIFVLPRVAAFSSHGEANQAVVGGGLDPTFRTIFYICVLVLGLWFVFAYKLRVQSAKTQYHFENQNELSNSNSSAADNRVVRPNPIHHQD